MYYYILDKGNKRVFEFIEGADNDNKEIFKSMGIKIYSEFPYVEAGFDNPFDFMDEYKIIKFFTQHGSIEVEEI